MKRRKRKREEAEGETIRRREETRQVPTRGNKKKHVMSEPRIKISQAKYKVGHENAKKGITKNII